MERTNLAGRAGRWSAGHWKTAFFGWLIFVFVAIFLGTTIGTNKLLDSDSGDGESGRAQKILGSGDFKEPASESVLIQSTEHVARDPQFRVVINDVVVASPAGARGDGDRLAARRDLQEPGPGLRGPALGARPLRHQGRGRGRARPRPGRPRRDRRGPEGEPGLHRRGVRRRERAEGAGQDARRRLQAGREARRPGHADHPALRLRLAGRRGDSRAARVLGRARRDRALGAPQPRDPGLRRDPVGDPARRDGGRGRLLALLPQARAGGARPRPHAARRALTHGHDLRARRC